MMLLAVDSATTSCSVALLDGRRLVAEATYTDGRTHSRHLLAMIDAILEQGRCPRHRLEGIAVTRGPGTFTGLRIGLSTVKGLASALGIPVAGVSSLAALAYPLTEGHRPVAPLIDARRGEIYHAVYRNPGECVSDPVQAAVDAPQTVAACLPEGAVLVGSGAVMDPSLWSSGDRKLQLAAEPFHVIRAFSVGLLAQKRLVAGQGDRIDQLAPDYIRPSDAQIQMAGSC